jgi:uncharacterized repeat protein (TIGR03803 family)
MRSIRLSVAASVAAGCVIAMLAAQSAQAQTYKVLNSFKGGTDGETPFAGVIQDSKGNLYGTTEQGGGSGGSCFTAGCGTVFKLSKTGKETILYAFTGGADGTLPLAGVIQDTKGNLYGTTVADGRNGSGIVFKLSKTGKETVLHTFTGPDGNEPSGELIQDAEGNLYGTTYLGGTSSYGTVFKLSKIGKETVLHSFTYWGSEGYSPGAGVVRDAQGELYGTTSAGGAYNSGTVFKLSQAGKLRILYSFRGLYPRGDGDSGAGLIQDAEGNLYGTTSEGGDISCPLGDNGCGIVFKLSKAGKETVLYRFTGGLDGAYPGAGVVRDAQGNLYGTTYNGGDLSCENGHGCGVVFELSKAGKETVLHTFTGGPDGANPQAGVIRDATGNLYGTASRAGNAACPDGCGVVFKLTP